MASAYRDITSDRIMVALDFIEKNPHGVAEEVHKKVVDYLAEEFLKKYKDGILGAINADDIAYKLNDAIAEVIKRKLLGENNEPA